MSGSVNKVIIVGNLARDVEVSYRDKTPSEPAPLDDEIPF